MTATTRQPRIVSADVIAFRWRVAPAALGAKRDATIVVRVDGTARATMVVDGAESALATGDATWTRDGDLLHIDAPCVIHATLRESRDGGLHALYARCTAANMPGGRCEFVGAAWEA
ncbi:MAG: hypothetical protein ACKVW3_17370 [Phycisphaerales bacterium]